MLKNLMKPSVVMLGTAPETKGGISSVVITYKNAGLIDDSQVKYISTHTDKSNVLKVATFLFGLTSFAWVLAFHKPDLIHIHTSSRASLWRKYIFVIVAKLSAVPYIIHLHGSEFHVFFERELSPFVQRFVRAFFSRAAAVIVLSQWWKTWVEQHCPAQRIVVVHNPVLLPSIPVESRLTNGAPIILFLGRLGGRKGTFDLIKAFALIADEFADCRLVLGGDGEVENAKALAATLGLQERVECVGWVTGDRKTRLLTQATVYALPSHNEGLPISVLEAMAYGLAIVTTPVGGIPEAIVDGVTGLMVPPGDIEALANALRRLLREPALRASLGAGCIRRVREYFAADSVVPRVRALYAEIIAGSSR